MEEDVVGEVRNIRGPVDYDSAGVGQLWGKREVRWEVKC